MSYGSMIFWKLYCRYLQQNTTISSSENLRYSIYITTRKGESEPNDLPFLFPQSRIFRDFCLAQDLKMRCGSDIHIVSVKITSFLKVQIISIYRNLAPRFNFGQEDKFFLTMITILKYINIDSLQL